MSEPDLPTAALSPAATDPEPGMTAVTDLLTPDHADDQRAERERLARARTQGAAPHPSVAEGEDRGKAARATTPRRSLSQWAPAVDRADPVELLRGQETSRVQGLLPVRHARMATSEFAFYRGSAIIMAADTTRRPTVRRCPPGQLRGLCRTRPLTRVRRQRLRRDKPGSFRVGRQAPRDLVRACRAR